MDHMKNMTETELTELERMNRNQLVVYLTKLGTAGSADLVIAILRSYRVAAHVATAAWRLNDAMELGVGTVVALTSVKDALKYFAPVYFKNRQPVREAASHTLELVYNAMQDWDFKQPNGVEDFMEQLFDKIVTLREGAADPKE